MSKKTEQEQHKVPDKSEPRPPKDLPTKIREWLDTQGYPLEMRVASAFHQARGYTIEQSHYYTGDDGQLHEIDVYASRARLIADNNKETAFVTVDVVVECKSNPKTEKPWIVFTAPANPIHESLGTYYNLMSRLAVHVVEEHEHQAAVAKARLFDLGARVGYGIACANVHEGGNSNDDLAYRAVSKLVRAAEALHYENLERGEFRITIPVLAVRTPLFECYLEDGELQIAERKQQKLMWPRAPKEPHERRRVTVNVVHESGMADFARNIAEEADALLDSLQSEILWAAVIEQKARERQQ